MLILITCFFGIVIFATYEADLTTRMTVKEQPLALRSFGDIADALDYQMITRPGTSYYNLLQAAKSDSPLNRIFKTIEGNSKNQLTLDCDDPCKNRVLHVSCFKCCLAIQVSAMFSYVYFSE